VPAENEGLTDVWFAIRGANLNLDEDGNVTSVIDAGAIRDFYLAMCEGMGLPRPAVIGL
jgi:2,4'-dihydroxyacetophenone dioxygenase